LGNRDERIDRLRLLESKKMKSTLKKLVPSRVKKTLSRLGRMWQDPRRSYYKRRKLSYSDLREFGKQFATQDRTLIVYIEFPYDDLLPNADVLPHFSSNCERYFSLLSEIPDESYSTVVATGLLEHMREPQRLLEECFRILTKGGKLYVSASAVFSIHRGPEDFFHVTHFGMKELLKGREWSAVDIRGSCGPFKSCGILLQRILLQCETSFWIRPFVEMLAHLLPKLDRFIVKQYSDRSDLEEKRIDSMAPSNIQLIATK
jgi:SAM-dependent methyltransferase